MGPSDQQSPLSDRIPAWGKGYMDTGRQLQAVGGQAEQVEEGEGELLDPQEPCLRPPLLLTPTSG